uniref:CPG4 domain-containing protein n=1 Tax=Heterorhabditis bacteriophora TaxID=37862 RepID=A0A1I7XJU8_HETBA
MLVLILSLPILALTATDPIDQVANQGVDIFLRSRISGQTVRQCSCTEQRECVEEMKAQAKECTVPCFARFDKITDRPNDLKKCFDDKDDILQGFLNCFEQRVDGCVTDENGPQISKTNIAALFAIGEKRIVHQTATMQAIIAPIKNIIDAAGEFAVCVKDCFINKNINGYCFDKKNCQPYISENKAKASLRQCTKRMNWKREAGEFCECSVDAGVTELKQYCTMFRLMGKRPNNNKRRS